MTPPQLSVNLMPTAPVSTLVELATLAESLGCARCWVYDEGLVTRDVYLTLGAIAAATTTVGLGPGITNPYVRHPGATAAAIATLDEMSGGRAFVGLGAGGGLTLGPLDVERTRPLQAVGDTVTALRGLFAGERVHRRFGHFGLVDAELTYAGRPIEIVLAGRGPKMMALARDVADGFYLSYLHKDLLGEAIAAVRPVDRPFRLTYSTMIAFDDADLDAARAQLSFRLVDSPPDVRALLGLGDDDVGALRAALADGGPTAAARLVRPEWVEHFVIAGDDESCARELDELCSRHGIDEFLLAIGDPEQAADRIRRVAALLGQT